MALVVRCPGCGTTFRVNAMQLQAHSGDVRCGHCLRIFNGFATLITVHESIIENPFQLQSQSTSQPEQNETEEIPITEKKPEAVENFNDESNFPAIVNQDPVDTVISQQHPVDEKQATDQQQMVWMAANVLLLLLLIAQTIYSYRTELALIAPASRPYLERYCDMINCTVAYPQDIKQLGIVASDLQRDSERQPEVIILSAIIRNHAPFPQALPALQLSLTDEEDQLIASRIFTAQDYLSEQEKSLQSIQSHQDIEILLYFDGSNLDASGYSLNLLYP